MLNEKLLPVYWSVGEVALQMWCMGFSFPVVKSFTADGSNGSNLITRRCPPSSGHLHLPSHLVQSQSGQLLQTWQ